MTEITFEHLQDLHDVVTLAEKELNDAIKKRKSDRLRGMIGGYYRLPLDSDDVNAPVVLFQPTGFRDYTDLFVNVITYSPSVTASPNHCEIVSHIAFSKVYNTDDLDHLVELSEEEFVTWMNQIYEVYPRMVRNIINEKAERDTTHD